MGKHNELLNLLLVRSFFPTSGCFTTALFDWDWALQLCTPHLHRHTHTHLQQEKHLSMLENAFCHILWDAETSAGCCRMILILNALTGSNRIEAQQNFLSIYLNLFFQDSIHFLFLMLLSTSFHVPSLPLMFLSHPFFIPSPPWHQLNYFQTFFAWYQIC